MGSFDSLTFGQRNELLSKGVSMSNCFKTGLQFGLQPCIFPAEALELLQLYLSFMRPKMMENSDDLLFITFNGTPLRVGRFVTAFFKRALGLNISTTRIRCIVETESSDLLLKGEIDQEARDSVLAVNGHSSITSQKFYQKRSRNRDVRLVQKVHSKLIASPDSAVDSDSEETIDCVREVFLTPERSPVSSASSVLEPVSNVNVGVLHPCYDVTGRKVTWSATEVNIVGTWCTQHLRQHPESINVVSNCLRYILSNSNVRQYFHPHHVVDSTRLRWGWEKYQNDNSK